MMENPPVNAAPKPTSRTISLSLAILTAPLPEVRDWLDEPPMSARNLAEILQMVRLTFYVVEATGAERKAWLLIWMKALRGIPTRFTADAFDDWFGTQTKRPTFADIGNYARKNMADARRRIREAEPRERERENAITAEEMERRRAIIEEYGYTVPRLRAIPKGEEPCLS